ncbi:unnamed protein product [Closterium sp. Yama58-4]|nr:unnamed protein product [Closterium sp. Yama58-4]
MPLTWKGVIFVGQSASVVDTLTEAGLTNYMGEHISDSDSAGAVAVSQHELSGEQSVTDSRSLKTEGQGSTSSIGYSGWYEGGIFEFLISFPNDYPRSPPQLRFVPPPLHPQIAADGLLVLDDARPPLQEIHTPQAAQRNTSSGKGSGHVIPLLFHVHRMFQTLRPWAPNRNPLRLMNGPDAGAIIIASARNGGETAGEGHGWEGGEEGAGGRGDGAAVGNPAAAAMLAHARDDLYAAVRRCVASSVKRAETQARIRAGFWETNGRMRAGVERADQPRSSGARSSRRRRRR